MDIFVARQAIFNTNKQVVAYELLFRNNMTNAMDSQVDGYQATQSVIANSLVFLGLDRLTGGKRAFINFTDRNLKDGSVKLLPSHIVSVEILENVEPTKALIHACKELKQLGYQLVLDDFVFHPRYQPLIDLADIIKVDFLLTTERQTRAAMRSLVPAHIQLLAEKVETEADYQQGLALGYTLFQGYFFCKPDIITHKSLPVTSLAQVMLLQAVNQAEYELENIEKIIKHDVSLTHKLLKYINSPGIGVTAKISSIRQAIVLLGANGIRNWATLVAMRELAAEKPAELFTLSLVRAKWCELLAGALGDAAVQNGNAFLLGIFSLLDVILGQPMKVLLEELHLETDIEAALLGKGNKLFALLQVVRAYEQGDWQAVNAWCVAARMHGQQLAVFYQQAVCWADMVIDVRL